MTTITFQNEKPVMIEGVVSTKQECCCDFSMPTTLTLTLSDTPNVYFKPATVWRERWQGINQKGGDFWPSAQNVLAKCGRSWTPMLDKRTAPLNTADAPYSRFVDELTDYVPGGMPLQDQTIQLSLSSQVPGHSYTYTGYAIRPPTNLYGPPPGQGLNDDCIDCGGTEGYELTPFPAMAGDTALSFHEPIQDSGAISGVLRIKGVEYPYAGAEIGGYSLSLLTPLAEDISEADKVTILTELVEVQLIKRCAVGVPVSVCIPKPTQSEYGVRATATATVVDGVVTSVTVTNGGSGYAKSNTGFVEPTGYVEIIDDSGSGAVLSVEFYKPAYEWGVQSVSVVSRGSGYSSSASAVFVPTNGTYAPFDLFPWLRASVGADGGIDGVTVDWRGSLLREASTGVESDSPDVGFCAMSGDGAAASAVVDSDPGSPTFGQITGISVTAGGSGYSDSPKDLEWWTCSVVFISGVSKAFSAGYGHASWILDSQAGYDCCDALERCRIDDDQRMAPCPKPLLNREYDMVLPFAGSYSQLDETVQPPAIKYNYSPYHCGKSQGVGGIHNCDLGTVSGCKEETIPTVWSTPLTVVYTPLVGIKCKLAPGPQDDCDTAWLAPLCDGTCPGDSSPMASLVSLKIESDCGDGATGSVKIGCIEESGVVATSGVILSASVTNAGTGYAKFAYSEPTLTLAAPGGTGGVLTIKNYNKVSYSFGDYWSIGDVEVTKAGSGYTDNSQVTISLGSGDEGLQNQSTPNIRIRTGFRAPNDDWTLQAGSQAPTGTGLVVSLILAPHPTEPNTWWVDSWAITSGGTGYAVGQRIRPLANEGNNAQSPLRANLEIKSVSAVGEVTSLDLVANSTSRGRYAIDSGIIDRVEFGTSAGIVWRGAYRKKTADLCNVTVSLEQQPPSDGAGAVINAVVQTDPNKAGFGTITGLTVVSGGSGYVARCCGNPFP